MLFRKAVAVVQEEMGNDVIPQCSLCGNIPTEYGGNIYADGIDRRVPADLLLGQWYVHLRMRCIPTPRRIWTLD